MSFCFLANLATSWRIACTRAEVERLLRGALSVGPPTSGRLCWDVAVEGVGGRSEAWLWCRGSLGGLPRG